MIKSVKQIKCFDSFISGTMIADGGGDELSQPILIGFYVIETEDKLIAIDSSCDTMGGWKMDNFKTAPKALEDAGINIDDITDVILTHAHHDHIDGIRHFKNARVYIQKDEYEREGHRYIPEDCDLHIFETDFMFDDDIKVVVFGGHSDGSCVVEFTFNGQKCVIAGDECYSNYNIQNKIPTAMSRRPEKSREFIEKYTNGEWKILLQHEFSEYYVK